LSEALSTLAEDLVLLERTLVGILIRLDLNLFIPVLELLWCYQSEQVSNFNDEGLIEHIPYWDLQDKSAKLSEFKGKREWHRVEQGFFEFHVFQHDVSIHDGDVELCRVNVFDEVTQNLV
jgi:hypothetical protein